MRQFVIYGSLFGSLTILMLTINLFDTLLMFIFFGIVPNSTQQLSANQMLTVHGSIALLLAAYAFRRKITSLVQAISIHRTRTNAPVQS